MAVYIIPSFLKVSFQPRDVLLTHHVFVFETYSCLCFPGESNWHFDVPPSKSLVIINSMRECLEELVFRVVMFLRTSLENLFTTNCLYDPSVVAVGSDVRT